MKYNKMSRRHFLNGAGKSVLALPFLPSLMTKAEAQTLPNSKCMVIFWSGHGGINLQNINPLDSNPAISSQLTSQLMYSAQGHSVRYGNLVNMKTTLASNLPYLGNYLGYDLVDENHILPPPDAYGLGFNGADLDAGLARVSPIIGNFVSDAHLNKMNLIAGLDMMYDSGHTRAQTGNFCNYDGNDLATTGQIKAGMPNIWIPTIDAVVAKYAAFYGSSSPIAKSVLLNSQWGSTDEVNGYMSCDRASNGIVPNPNSPGSVGEAFNLLFGSLKTNSNSSVLDKRTFVLNNVYQDYSRLARGAYGPGRRIGKDDRTRLEEFMTNLNSILKGVLSGSGSACSAPSISSTDKSQIIDGSTTGTPFTSASTPGTLSLYNQIIAASFACGVSKIFFVGIPGLKDQFVPEGSPGATFSDGNGNTDAHHGIHHNHNLTGRQRMLAESMRFFFQYGFYDLVKKLDSTPGVSGSLLDQSFMFWTHQAGFKTHGGQSLPMITAGAAGGFIKTGKYVDYRNPQRLINNQWICGADRCTSTASHQGLSYNRFLATALQSMGLAPSDYELQASLFAGTAGRIPTTSRGTVPGYGHPFQVKYAVGKIPGVEEFAYDYQLNDLSVPLPIIT